MITTCSISGLLTGFTPWPWKTSRSTSTRWQMKTTASLWSTRTCHLQCPFSTMPQEKTPPATSKPPVSKWPRKFCVTPGKLHGISATLGSWGSWSTHCTCTRCGTRLQSSTARYWRTLPPTQSSVLAWLTWRTTAFTFIWGKYLELQNKLIIQFTKMVTQCTKYVMQNT